MKIINNFRNSVPFDIEQSKKNIAVMAELSERLKLEEEKLIGYIKDKFRVSAEDDYSVAEVPPKKNR